MSKPWVQIAKDFVLPLLLAMFPLAPTIYDWLTAPSLHFVYEVNNRRNPITEWDRQIAHMFKELDAADQVSLNELPNSVVKKIGSEIYKILPALLSGVGVRPSESTKVSILNVADQELRDIRVHFAGCEGFDTYETFPDSYGSVHNPSPTNHPPLMRQVTLRYDKLSPSTSRTNSVATIVYYGESTSNCAPTVEAELANGKTAIGKKATLQDYVNETTWDKYNREKLIEIFYKVCLALAVLYLYISIRRLQTQPRVGRL